MKIDTQYRIRSVFLGVVLLLLTSYFVNAQNCKCQTSDYKNWNQGELIFESGEIKMLESLDLIINDITNPNIEKGLIVNSRINVFHDCYHFNFYFVTEYEVNIPKESIIKLINNKGLSIVLDGSKSTMRNFKGIHGYINITDVNKRKFITSGIITKIQFLDINNKRIIEYYLSISDSVNLKKMFCCAIELKEEIIGQEK